LEHTAIICKQLLSLRFCRCRCCPLPPLQVYGDADLLLSSYSVPLEYDPDLIQQVRLYCLMYCLMYRLATGTACSQAQPTPHTAWNLPALPPLQVVGDLTPRNARVMWCSKTLEVGVWLLVLPCCRRCTLLMYCCLAHRSSLLSAAPE
jgi:hypothetical protein